MNILAPHISSSVLEYVDHCFYMPPQDGQRQKAHEMLEAETITASVLRHRLANFPHRLRVELQGLSHIEELLWTQYH